MNYRGLHLNFIWIYSKSSANSLKLFHVEFEQKINDSVNKTTINQPNTNFEALFDYNICK